MLGQFRTVEIQVDNSTRKIRAVDSPGPRAHAAREKSPQARARLTPDPDYLGHAARLIAPGVWYQYLQWPLLIS